MTKSTPRRDALPADVIALVIAVREALETEELSDSAALDRAVESFASRVCYDDEGGTLPEAHADPCSCGSEERIPQPDADREASLWDAGQFLLDRLSELEWSDDRLEDTARDYFGHVEPALERFRAALADATRPQVSDEAVAVIGNDWRLLWANQKPLTRIVERTGIKIGSKLYAHPQPSPAIPEGGIDLGEPVTLNECPPGLFIFNGHMGFKSEYITTLENPHRYQVDAFVVESGEYFWGGAKGTDQRGKLLVQPISLTYTPKPAPQPDADLSWFSEQHRLSLHHYSPLYGDDDDQSVEWRVAMESGPINDRELTVVGRGETASEAIAAARAYMVEETPKVDARHRQKGGEA